MICGLTGRLAHLDDDSAVIDVGGVSYEVLVPAASRVALQDSLGQEARLFTVQYLEGNPALGNLVPRLAGFVSALEREFFHQFVKVKGISTRKALRAMSVPIGQLAAAIESGDERALASLPEIGKKTAAQIVLTLRGTMTPFITVSAPAAAVVEFSDAQKLALEILVQWGDRRIDAQRWIALAVEQEPRLGAPEEIVRAAYRVKAGAQR